MTAPSSQPGSSRDQRQALEDSERKASEGQPGNFKDSAIDDKVVEIPPIDKDGKPIRGLDPE